MSEVKPLLFKVVKRIEPEWGKDRIEWVKYFTAPDDETVRQMVRERYGGDRYYSMDRISEKYSIESVEYEALDSRVSSSDRYDDY